MPIQKYHPAQRFEVFFPNDRPVEFVGSTERFDIFWIADDQKVLVKHTNERGSGMQSYAKNPQVFQLNSQVNWLGVRPSGEEVELIWAMAKLFATINRPIEWEENAAI